MGRLKSSLRKFYGRHQELVDHYRLGCSIFQPWQVSNVVRELW